MRNIRLLVLAYIIGLLPTALAAPPIENIAHLWKIDAWSPLETQPINIAGVATLFDRERELLVLQEGQDVISLEFMPHLPEVEVGQRIAIKAGDSWPALVGIPRFPLKPDFTEQLSSFESRHSEPQIFYIARFRGWIHPPASGEYHFSIASDDASELLLGTDAAPQTRRPIARVTSYTEERDWFRMKSQRSESIYLEAGRAYYIEAVHQQAHGPHHLSVAWEGPGIPLQIIEGSYLTPWHRPPGFVGRVWSPSSFPESLRGSILREVWQGVTIDYPAELIVPRKLTGALIAHEASVRVLGAASWPEPQPMHIGQPVSRSENFRWSQVEGTVTYLSHSPERTTLELADGNKRVEVILVDASKPLPAHLRGRRVRVEGAGEAVWEGAQSVLGRIWAPSTDALTLLQEPPHLEYSRVTSIHELNQPETPLPDGAAVKLVGRVSAIDGKRVVLSDEGTFQAFTSSDGVDWTPLGPPIEINMPQRLLAGLALNSNYNDRISKAEFTDVSGPSLPLTLTDVGDPRVSGSFTLRNGRYSIEGVGREMWNTPDQFTFLHAPLEGNTPLVARLASISPADPTARVGIMVRESLAPDAQFVQLVQSESEGRLTWMVQWRTQLLGRSPHSVEDSSPAETPLAWAKLERRINEILVQANTEVSLNPGERVEVAGYVTRESGETLIADASVRPVQSGQDDASSGGFWRPVVEIASVLDPSRHTSGLDFYRIHGVVTFHGEVAGRHYWAVQDESGALLMQMRDPKADLPIAAGTRVFVDSNPGWFPPASEFLADSILRLGPAALPRPLVHPAEYLLPRRGEGTWIEIEGVARTAGDGQLEVKTKGELFSVALPGVPRSQLLRLVDARVRVRGAIAYPNERERLLLVPSLQHIDVLRPSAGEAFSRPIQSSREAAAEASRNDLRHRLRTSGIVTLASPTVFFVQDKWGAVQVEPAVPGSLAEGMLVEVAGFPDPGDHGGVVLRQALVREMGTRAAREIVPEEIERSGTDATKLFQVVRLQAHVTRVQGDWLELEVDGRLWRVARPVNGAAFPALPTGSSIRVTGVLVPPAAQYPWVRPAEGWMLRPAPQLLLRHTTDITVLSTPRWWALRRTLMVTGLVSVVIGGAFIWIQILRRRVRQRSAELKATMKKLEEEVRISATLAERDRLAGEIHDSVEQGLNGLVIQLESTAQQKVCPPEVRSALLLARNMAAFSRTEVKHAIWELQSPLLEDSDLPQAIHEVVAQTVPTTTKTTIKVDGTPRRLGSALEHHLLRLVQEAVNNAVKHAQARSITIDLVFDPEAVKVTVTDDGCGFDPKNRQSLTRLGHFGLSGMQNRSHRISAELEIVSSPGQGTQVKVRVPTPSSPPSS